MVLYQTGDEPRPITSINSNISGIRTYVGADGKLHFVDAGGADTALNFSSRMANRSLGIIWEQAANGDKNVNQTINVASCNAVIIRYVYVSSQQPARSSDFIIQRDGVQIANYGKSYDGQPNLIIDTKNYSTVRLYRQMTDSGVAWCRCIYDLIPEQ